MIRKAIRYVADQVLEAIQRRCEHPDEMVAVDITEGTSSDMEVRYCRRCGAVNLGWKKVDGTVKHWGWRTPCPNLWRGYRAP